LGGKLYVYKIYEKLLTAKVAKESRERKRETFG